MVRLTKQERVDSLIQHFWKNGVITLSRKYSKYLPQPAAIGEFEIDAIGKLNKKFIFGLTLSEEDLNNPKILRKIEFLANQKNKYTSKPVTLFVGVPEVLYDKAKNLIAKLDAETQKRIKLVETSTEKDLFD
jgi:hypothetical protein